MRVLVCGSRHFNDRVKLDEVLRELPIDTVIEGEAKGADRLSRDWAEDNNVPVQKFPANWELYGKRAGPIRNTQMLKEGKPEMVVAFLAQVGSGTAHMIRIAEEAGIPVTIVDVIVDDTSNQ